MTKEEFDNLEMGDIVRGGFSGIAFVITSRAENGYIGVRTQNITNPDEWELIVKAAAAPSRPASIRGLPRNGGDA